MKPLALSNVGEETIIRKISGTPEIQKHLEDLGFVDAVSAKKQK